MNVKTYDAVIIGGGASGLMCAISAKRRNQNIKIAIIEKNDRVGKKLLSTGNGRCNLTNADINPNHYCGTFAYKSQRIFEKYTTDCVLDIFKGLGLLTTPDSEGRYYPICKQASSVLDVLRFACENMDIDIFCGKAVKSIKKQGCLFVVNTAEYSFHSSKLVIACGSKAAPKLGASAAALDYLKNFGHKTVPFSPALCPVKVNSPVLKSLKGIRCSCMATLQNENGNAIKTELGEVQFADGALSGICIFNLSLFTHSNYTVSLDLLPNISSEELYFVLEKQKLRFQKLPIENFFTGILHKRLGQAVIKLSGLKDMSRECLALNQNEIKSICGTVKNMRFDVISNSGFDQAQAALGGAVAREIDENTMQSRLVKNLYIIGEAVDICGECGGFNLHFAFASGHLAGECL